MCECVYIYLCVYRDHELEKYLGKEQRRNTRRNLEKIKLST